jgi:phospholipase/carboxylesterase
MSDAPGSDGPAPIGEMVTDRIQVGEAPRLAVVLLHGYGMRGSDLAPFAHSLGVPAVFYVPDAPLQAVPSGRAWWVMDQEKRRVALQVGPRDLATEVPAGAPAARALLGDLVARVRREHPALPVALIGFSQGGMLACDALLHDTVRVDALALLSSSRIDITEWSRRTDRLRGLPVLVSHGEADDDLAFTTGLALRDFCVEAGARVTWIPFPDGHAIPLVVWRGIRRFLAGLTPRAAPTSP